MKEMIEKLKLSGYSQAKIARICGISDAALSNYLSGKYNANDLSLIEEKIRSGIEIELKRIEHKNCDELPFFETETVRNIFNVALICHTRKRMGLIYGGAGLGKTRACLEYAKRNKNTIYIEARPSFTARTLMLKLAKMLSCNTKTNQYELEEEIIEKLRESGKLIIIDEAEHLNHRALETLRTVVYNASHTGLLLVGLEHLKYQLIGLKGKNEYLSSRCLANRKITALTEKDSEIIISNIFGTVSNSIKKAFKSYCNSNIRLLENTIFEIQRLLSIPQNRDAELSEDLIKFAAEIAVLR